MPHNPKAASSSSGESPALWLLAKPSDSGDLLVAEFSPAVAEWLGREGGDLGGARISDLFSAVTPSAIIGRVGEIAQNGGEAFFPRCRIPTSTGERWFSLECLIAEPGGVMLSFGPPGIPLLPAGQADLAGESWDRFPWCLQTFDRTGQIIDINAAFERATGLTRADLLEYNILYDPAYSRDDLAGRVERVLAGEMIRFDILAGIQAREPLRLFENARRRIYPARAFPLIDGQGEVAGIVMAYDDAGAEKGVVDYVAAERDFAQKIIQTADTLIICLDTAGRITLFNPKCEQTSGWKREEVLGRYVWDTLIPARWVEKIRNIFAKFTETNAGLSQYQNPWLTKDGRERMISWHITYHFGPDGKIERITSIGVDITDQSRIEQQLRESEERYRSVTESSLTGIFIYRDDRFVYCNARLEEILGLHRDMIINRQVWELVHPKEREMIKDRAKRRQKGDSTLPTHYTFRAIHSSGETRWLEMIVAPMEYMGHSAFIANVIDITERKAAETERDALRRRLEQAERMEALATLVGGIAHDFNNLLVGIMAGTSDVLAQTEPDDPRFKPLGEILQTSRRAKDLISQLLTAGSRGPSAMAPLDLREVIQEAARFIRPTLKEGIKLQVSVGEQPITIMGDRSQLWQTLTNLCLNARDAMPEGGVLQILAEEDKEKILVCVRDTGKGIPAEIKDRIFEPFFTTKPRGMGIGLGLAVAYGAVKNHGATIEVRDNPGGGTVFYFRLERAKEKPAETARVSADEDRASKHTILIVDDEDGVRHIVGRILGREGHVVQTAQNADETMEKIREYGGELDLVILDLEMPGKSGAHIFGEIRKVRPELKILLSSGQVPGSQAKRLLADGAVGFLQKPYDLWELRRAVKDAVV